jgi:hypothetical protein
VLRGTREELVPVTGVLLAVALAVLPLVVAGPEAGLELLHPMAVTVLGGLVTTAFVVLLVVPGAYAARRWRLEEHVGLDKHVGLEEHVDLARPAQREAAHTQLVTTAAKD